MNNVLTQIVQDIPMDVDNETIYAILTESLSVVDTLYSYIVYSCTNDCDFYRIKYMISETSEYNTINANEAAIDIYSLILKDKLNAIPKKVLGYKQPNIDIFIVILDPLVCKLSSKMHKSWGNYYDYDDLCQMCRLTIIELMDKGYYIHRSLVQKAFTNYVLCSLRKERGKPVMINFGDSAYGNGSSDCDMDKLTIADIVPDTDELLIREDELDREVEALIMSEVRDLIIDMIGKRQYEELLREYGTNNTTSWSRRTLQKIKSQFSQEGLTKNKFIEKYHGGRNVT